MDSICPKAFYSELIENDFSFFAGVPDSTFKGLISYIETVNKENHITTTNEGEAVSIGIGYHLATRKIPVIYLQNSGFGNLVNPLTSLCDKAVYDIPLLFLIGWRGEPGTKDEPQHYRLGSILLDLLKLLDVEYTILDSEYKKQISQIKSNLLQQNKRYAVLIKNGLIGNFKDEISINDGHLTLTRERIIEICMENFSDEVFVSTTGKTSRELYELRIKANQPPRDFYTVGGMGHAASIAYGLTRGSNKRIILLNGDGAFFMHMGVYTTQALTRKNLVHIIIDNNAHESTGGQKTVSNKVSIYEIMSAIEPNVFVCDSEEKFILQVKYAAANRDISCVIIVKCFIGQTSNVGRPKTTPIENKNYLMRFIAQDQ